MNLSPPTTAVFAISLILAVLAVIGTFVAIPVDQRQCLLGGDHRLYHPGRGQRLPGRVAFRRCSGRPRPSGDWAARPTSSLAVEHERRAESDHERSLRLASS